MDLGYEKLHTSASGSGRHGAIALVTNADACCEQQERAKEDVGCCLSNCTNRDPPHRVPRFNLAIGPHLLLRQRFRLIRRVGLVVQIQESRPAALELALPRAAHGLALRVRHDDVEEVQGTDLLRAVLLHRDQV